MNSEDTAASLRRLGLNLSPAEVVTLQRRHAASVAAAKERHKAWGRWELMAVRDAHHPFDVYRNREYTATVSEVATGDDYFGVVTYLMCARNDGAAVHSWLDLQQIKTQLIGAEAIALEVYPAESHLLDTANCYHLWILRGRAQNFPLDLKVLQRNLRKP
jgi:hypothetical protein